MPWVIAAGQKNFDATRYFRPYFTQFFKPQKAHHPGMASFITLRFVRKSERKRTRNKSFGGFGASVCSRTLLPPDGRIVPDAVRPVATESIALELAKVVSLILTWYGNPLVARLGNTHLIDQATWSARWPGALVAGENRPCGSLTLRQGLERVPPMS